MMRTGQRVFSPVTHGHAIVMLAELPLTWEFWKSQCDPFLERMDELHVLMLDGWRYSVGVSYEIDVAAKRDVPIVFHSVPEDLWIA